MRAAVIDAEGLVVNVTILSEDYDSEAEGAWQPPEGHFLVLIGEEDRAEMGWSYDGSWVEPEPVDPTPTPPTIEELAAENASLRETVIALQAVDAAMLDDFYTIYEAVFPV